MHEQQTPSTDPALAETQGNSSSAKLVQTNEPLGAKSFFKSLQIFQERCRIDKKLTPAVQLTYRLLVEEANRNFWQESFPMTLDKLEEISHMSRPTIVNARQVLKSKGFINFDKAKPTNYIIHSLVNQSSNHRLNQFRTPKFDNTRENFKYNTNINLSKEEVNSGKRTRDIKGSQSDLTELQRRIELLGE